MRPKPGTTFVHRHKLDPTWTPGPGQRYRYDAPYAESYVLQVDNDADFSSPVVDTSSLTESQYAVPEGMLSPEVTYYWRVTAVNTFGTLDASNNEISFTTSLDLSLDYLGGGCSAARRFRPACCLQALLAGILLLAATRRIRRPTS